MFTGIIDHCGEIVRMDQQPDRLQLCIQTMFTDLELGESIAVDGVCLTITKIEPTVFYCDVSPETLRLTTIGGYKVNQCVNLERALLPSTRMGGHFVTGHIDQQGTIATIRQVGEFEEWEIAGLTPQTKPYVIQKGSIAVNGVSLTVNSTNGNSFCIMLIPHTLQGTNLSKLHEGFQVNLEFDMMARIIVEQTRAYLPPHP